MNTPDTEWEERFNEVYPSVTVGYDGSEMDARRRAKVWQFIEDEITTLNARHHTALTSRDTYWKGRVRKEVEALISEGISLADDRECSRIITESDGSERTNMHYILDYKIKKHNQALDTLLDNLK